jgi:uncharacterized protein
MQRAACIIHGDTPGQQFSFDVLTFKGNDSSAPSAYLQAALHAGEFPGVAALHFLVPMLKAAESEGAIAGNITIVPMANPIGAAQWLFGEPQGRFDISSRTNFNRAHALLDHFDTSALPVLDAPIPAVERLKAELLRLALPHEIVLDLHCDDESEQYIYSHASFWPVMRDLAAALDCKAVLISPNNAGSAFEAAASNPAIKTGLGAPNFIRRAVSTVEFKGMSDVSADKGNSDAKGLRDFLVHRGTLKGKSRLDPASFVGPVTPLDHVEMIKMPVGGMVLYHVKPGDNVKGGARLATIVTRPGDASGDVLLIAPQAGRILTRRCQRFLRCGDDVLKLLGAKPSATAKAGPLEA